MGPRAGRWWFVPVAALTGCADIIGANDLRRVDCVAYCETASGAGGIGTTVMTTGDASSDARGGRSGGGGSAGSGGTGGSGPEDGGGEATGIGTSTGGASGAGGSGSPDGSTGAGGQAGMAGSGGAGGSDGGPVGVCPTAGWPAGWVCVNPGTFTMGSPLGEIGRDPTERQHTVFMTRPFWMQASEVTQAEWQATMGSNPSNYKACGSNCPVESVNWFSAVLYANALSMRDGYARCYEKGDGSPFDAAAATAKLAPNWRLGFACSGYRLPTEAEWEYAARAGTTTGYFSGDPSTTACTPLDAALGVAGWYCANGGNTTHPVRTKRANAWGIYDMHGNAYEWVWDWAAPYPTGAVTDPMGPSTGTQRQARGGSYYSEPQYCRSAHRSPDVPDLIYSDTGFRLARSIP